MSSNKEMPMKMDTQQIRNLFKTITRFGEFEFIFFSKGRGLPYEKYIMLLKFLSRRASNDKKLQKETTLDIAYNPDKETSYRVTLLNKDIDKYMKILSTANNHVIFRRLIIESQKDKNISVFKKSKSNENTIDVDDYYMRVRLSDELDLSKEEFSMLSKLDNTNADKIVFRFKKRTTLYIVDTENDYVKVDLTMTRTEPVYKRLNDSINRYELEIETKSKNKNEKMLDIMFTEAETLIKVIQQSNFIVTKSTTEKVIGIYDNLLSVPSTSKQALYGRQPVSLEIQYVESLANKYAVTDKADGERHFLIIADNHVYLINTNLDVRDTGIVLKEKQQKYDNSVLDGELILLKGRHVFLVFDCLFESGIDVRKQVKLESRLQSADNIINACFVFGKQRGNEFAKLPVRKSFDLKYNLDFHKSEIKHMFDDLNNDMELEKQFVLVRRKYFIHSLGAEPWEIYAYASLIWKLYTSDNSIKCPYVLDGLIFQPNDQSYVANKKESKFDDYKWKPPEKNSIDFYIEFEKDKEGNDLVVYDNSFEEISDDPNAQEFGDVRIRNKNYKICNLFVGQSSGKTQMPVLFNEQNGLNEAYILLKDGEARDIDGNILTDKTVVEFYYNMDSTLSHKFKWIALKTRYDKTEAASRKLKYGNYITVAEKVWQSIVNPVLISDFDDLAKGNNPEKNQYLYDKKLQEIRNKIGHELIISAAKENKYFQLITNLAQPMRSFHNFIKTNIIYTFCHSMYQNNKQKSILDLGCGRGADQNKFYYAKADFYVGVDFDKDALTNPIDSSMSRYERARRKPGFTKMYFIHGDFASELDYENQYKSIGGMEVQNKQLIEKFFSSDPKKRTVFDIINIQFAIHYAFKNEETFTNLKSNINNYLRDDGFVLITTFDGEQVRKLLEGKEKFTQEYTDENGSVKILFDIVKKYNDGAALGVGNAIDVHMAWISHEGEYLTEYLVDDKFMIDEFKRDCNLELVSTDLFENQLVLQKEYLTKYSQYEAEERTRKNLAKFAEIYNKNSVNDGSIVYTKLERYYVFRKNKRNATKSDKPKKGGQFMDTTKFVIDKICCDNRYSFLNSIHSILKKENLIPKTEKLETFCDNMDIEFVDDLQIDDHFENVAKNLVIYIQDVDSKPKKVLNGLNILLAERNCNDEYDVNVIRKNDKKIKPNDQAIILIKEGALYAPLYAISEGGNTGLFQMDNDIVKQFIENST